MSNSFTPDQVEAELRYSFIKDLIALEIEDMVQDLAQDYMSDEKEVREQLTADYIDNLKNDLT